MRCVIWPIGSFGYLRSSLVRRSRCSPADAHTHPLAPHCLSGPLHLVARSVTATAFASSQSG